MKTASAQSPPAAAQTPARTRVRLHLMRRDTAISESDIFSLLLPKEEECCNRATD